MNVNTSYGPDAGVHTSLPRERVDIGPAPDFWGDLTAMTKTMKPRPQPQGQPTMGTAAHQARSLRQPAPQREERMPEPQRPYDPYSGMRITPRSFGREQMTQHGVWGTYVNPADVPVEFQGHLPTGFFADDVGSNYTYSPLVDPARYGQPAGGKLR